MECQYRYLFIVFTVFCLIFISLEIGFIENFKLKAGSLVGYDKSLKLDQQPLDPFHLQRKDLEFLLSKQKYMSNNCSFEQKKSSVCTFELFQDYMKTCGYFPNKFNWKSGNSFQLSFCNFAENRNLWITHILNNKIENIVLAGDSNAFHFSIAVIDLFRHSGFKCRYIKHEPYGFKVQKTYFIRGKNSSELSKALISPQRTCRTCASSLAQCLLKRRNKTYKVTIEYISLTMSKNVIINETYCSEHASNEVCAHKYQADFIFRYYLRDHLPQILFMFTPIAHCVGKSFDDFGENFKYAMDMIEETLPESSHVVWIDYSACNVKNFSKPEKMPEPDLDRWNKTLLLNTYLFQMVYNKTFSSQGPQVHGFLDLFQLTLEKELDWASDYVHFKKEYYNTIIQDLFSMIPSLQKKVFMNNISV